MTPCSVPGCNGAGGKTGVCRWHQTNQPHVIRAEKPRPRKPSKPAVPPKPRRPVCAECGAQDPRQAYRVDPVNFRQHFTLLCTPCRKRLGMFEVDFTRPYAELHARSIMRGAA